MKAKISEFSDWLDAEVTSAISKSHGHTTNGNQKSAESVAHYADGLRTVQRKLRGIMADIQTTEEN